MKRIGILLMVLSIGLIGCEKSSYEADITEKKERKRTVGLEVEYWQMHYHTINGLSTMGDGSIWKFTNGVLVITETNGNEIAQNYYSNGSRIYILNTIADRVDEYFIDFISSDSLHISSSSAKYSFFNAY